MLFRRNSIQIKVEEKKLKEIKLLWRKSILTRVRFIMTKMGIIIMCQERNVGIAKQWKIALTFRTYHCIISTHLLVLSINSNKSMIKLNLHPPRIRCYMYLLINSHTWLTLMSSKKSSSTYKLLRKMMKSLMTLILIQNKFSKT